MEQAEILTRLRKEKGLSQTEVAEELGVTRQAISKWESGRAFPSMEKLIALSRVYGVALEEMYDSGMEEKPPEEETPAPESKGSRRKRITAGCVLAAYICFAAGILLWGKLANSPSIAANYLICGTLIYILGWFAYLLYLFFNLMWRVIKK